MKFLLGLPIVILIAYLLFWPVSIEPQAWSAPRSKGYQGDFLVNHGLASFEKLHLDGLHGPEAIAQDSQGNVYASTHEGWIVRWTQGQLNAQKWLKVGGRPLGLAFDVDGNLWVANAYFGLMRVTPEGLITTPVTSVNGVPVRYADDVAIAPNGTVYFSDASTKFSAQDEGTLEASLLDLMEHGRYGRVIEYDPVTQKSREVVSELSFANGVAIDPKGSYLLTVETGEYRVIKYWLSGSKAGTKQVIIDNLPGFPDNIHLGNDGRYWLGLTGPRVDIVDVLSDQPFLRKVIQRLPEFMRPNVAPYGMVIAIDGQGRVLSNLQDPSGAVYTTTGAHESAEFLYVSSLTSDFVARYKLSELDFSDVNN